MKYLAAGLIGAVILIAAVAAYSWIGRGESQGGASVSSPTPVSPAPAGTPSQSVTDQGKTSSQGTQSTEAKQTASTQPTTPSNSETKKPTTTTKASTPPAVKSKPPQPLTPQQEKIADELLKEYLKAHPDVVQVGVQPSRKQESIIQNWINTELKQRGYDFQTHLRFTGPARKDIALSIRGAQGITFDNLTIEGMSVQDSSGISVKNSNITAPRNEIKKGAAPSTNDPAPSPVFT
jgi:hypothetical protein